ncbi:MAG: hypothetical protein MJA30_16615, partial [Cytophagales bacterium]|nr:hypothetical protein [Cytophagales bacterium]
MANKKEPGKEQLRLAPKPRRPSKNPQMAPLPSEIDGVVYKPSDDWTKLGPQNKPVDTTPVNGVLPPGIILIIVVSVVGAVAVSVIIAACVWSQQRREKRQRNKALGRQQRRRWRWEEQQQQ